MLSRLLVLILFLKLSHGLEKDSMNMIRGYFMSKNVDSLKINCCSKKEAASFLRNLNGFKVKFQNLDHLTRFDDGLMGENRIGIYFDLDCADGLIIDKIKKYTNQNYIWLLKSENYTQAIATIDRFPLNWNSQFSLLSESGKIFDLYKTNADKSVEVKLYAYYSEGFKTVGKYERDDLNGAVVKGVVSLFSTPERTKKVDYLLERTEDPRDNLIKFSFTIHDLLLKKYNAKWHLHFVENSEAGKIYDSANGNLTYYHGGQFEILKKGQGDIGLYPGEQLSSGLDHVGILPSIYRFSQSIVFKHPKLFTQPGDLLVPFSTNVWYTLVLISALCVIGLRLASCANIEDSDHNEPSTLLNVVLVIGTVAQQGLTSSSDRVSKQIIHFALLILGILVYGFYNACLVILLLSPTPRFIDTVDKLVGSNFHIAAEDNPINRYQLSANYTNKIPTLSGAITFCNLSTGVKDLRDKQYAFYSHDSNIFSKIGEKFADPERCILAQIRLQKPFEVSTFVRKDFPYKELFSRGILLLKETGINAREDRFWNRERPQCLGQEEYLIADFRSAYLAYIIYFSGLFGSLIILSIEIYWNHHKQNQVWEKVLKVQ